MGRHTVDRRQKREMLHTNKGQEKTSHSRRTRTHEEQIRAGVLRSSELGVIGSWLVLFKDPCRFGVVKRDEPTPNKPDSATASPTFFPHYSH